MTKRQHREMVRVLGRKVARDFKRGASLASLADSYVDAIEQLGIGQAACYSEIISDLLRAGLNSRPQRAPKKGGA